MKRIVDLINDGADELERKQKRDASRQGPEARSGNGPYSGFYNTRSANTWGKASEEYRKEIEEELFADPKNRGFYNIVAYAIATLQAGDVRAARAFAKEIEKKYQIRNAGTYRQSEKGIESRTGTSAGIISRA